MIVFAEIGSQVERVQGISVVEIVALMDRPSSLQSFPVPANRLLYALIVSLLVVGLYRSHGVLLLTVQIQRNLVQFEVFEIELISSQVAVVCAIIHQSDHDTGG